MSKADRKLEAAILLREEGRHDEALAALKKLEKDREVGDAARYEQALLLHALGRHKEGDQYAAQLGFKYRLNNLIFEGGQKKTARSNGGKRVRVFDDLLPEKLLSELRSAFGPESDFWGKHDYPTDTFFSYNGPIVSIDRPVKKQRTESSAGKTAGSHSNETSTLALIRQVADCLLPAAKFVFPDQNSTATSAEWWAHSRRGCGAGHQLHFDLDELRVRGAGANDALPHPLASCVIFLEGSGGPTLLTDLSIDEPAPAAARADDAGMDMEGFLCPPAPGRVLVFDGSLLHGVCPTTCFDPAAPRTTLMMGLWADGVVTTTPSAGAAALGPNMTSISPGRAGKWTKMCQKSAPIPAKVSVPSPAAALIPCGRIWTRIASAGNVGGGESLAEVGRFMLRDPPATVRGLCIGAGDSPHAAVPSSSSKPSGPKVQSITLEELRRLRGEA
jgi:hypothetical protein